MIDWYSTVLGTEVLLPVPRWAPGRPTTRPIHRIALTAFPTSSAEDPAKDTRTGLHHTAFEYGRFDAAQREATCGLRPPAIAPDFCT